MNETLVDFVRVLRNAEIRVSPAETLDALHAVRAVGFENREGLRHALAASLAKTLEEKEVFDHCFTQYFSQRGLDSAILNDDHEAGEVSNEQLLGAPSMPGEAPRPESLSTLTTMLLGADDTALGAAMATAAAEISLSEIRFFTQKGLFSRRILDTMGLRELDQDIHLLEQVAAAYSPGRAEAHRLKHSRRQLWDRVRDYVEHHYLLYARQNELQLRESVLRATRLSNLERRDLHRLKIIVRRIAKRLASRYSARRRIVRRGRLDVPRTLRAGTATDGVLFNRHWRRRRKDRPSVLVLCDVSGSVSSYSRFLLLFLYSLNAVLPRIRSFVFCDRLIEVSELFDGLDADEAIETALTQYAMGSTDYGRSLREFVDQSGRDLDNRATLIILGDARNNYGDPALETMREISRRVRRVLWLNPESQSSWHSGDSEMLRYKIFCSEARVCRTLQDLERFAGDLLRDSH